MKLRSSIVWIVALLMCVSMASMAAQRDGRGRDIPPEGATREDVLRFQNKTRAMLEVVEMLQRRTGRPISYEDPVWVYEGAREKTADGRIIEKPGDITRTPGFRTTPNVPVKDILSLTTGSFEFKLNVDARSHRPAEPIDNSIRGVLPGVIADYTNRQLPGVYTFAYFGNVNDGGYGWAVLPVKFKNQKGELVEPARVLDYPITFPVATRSTQATLQLITELVSKESKQKVEFRKLVSEANMTGRPIETKPVDLPQNQVVKLSAQNEPARSVIARTLRNIERGNPRNHKPIPQRAWRLLYSIETGSYYLDVVDVKQELYRPDGSSAGLRLVPWPTETGAPPAGTK